MDAGPAGRCCREASLKRYTLKVQPLEDSVTRADFKTALEELLLRAQPSLTYRLGAIEKTASGSILAEIASDAKKDVLALRLQMLESRLPVRVEGLGWGWVTTEAQNPPADPNPVMFPLDKKFDVVRYLLLLSLPLVVIALIIARSFFHQPDGLELILYPLYVVWLFSMNETPLDFRLYARQIDCLPGELVLTYWFRKEASRMSWENIWGLEMKGRVCHIYNTSGPKVRFHLRSGLKDADGLIRAIAQRAGLNNVDPGLGRVLYKRYEAP